MKDKLTEKEIKRLKEVREKLIKNQKPVKK